MPERVGVVPDEWSLASPAGSRLAFVGVVRAFDQGPLVLRVAGLPAFLPEAGLGGARLTDGGSLDGGLEELVEFCLSLASSSATRAVRATFSARSPAFSATSA